MSRSVSAPEPSSRSGVASRLTTASASAAAVKCMRTDGSSGLMLWPSARL